VRWIRGNKILLIEYISISLYAYMKLLYRGGRAVTKASIEMGKAAGILKLLGNETRITILKILEDHDCCVCEFVEMFEVSQPSISQHLRKLKDLDLVGEDKRGQWIFYSINKENEYYHFVSQLLHLLPQQNEKIKRLEEKGTRIQCY